MLDTWQLVAEDTLSERTTGNDVCEVNIPAEWQGSDVDYKFVLSFEHLGEDKDAYPYLRMRTADGWENFRFGYIRLSPTGTVESYQDAPRAHCGFEWHVSSSYDSCVASGTISHPRTPSRYWNVVCHAGGISGAAACIYCGGGRAYSGNNILGFGLHSSASITWSEGTHLEIYARRRPQDVSA